MHEWQQQFREAVLGTDAGEVPAGVVGDRIAAADRFAIHRNNVQGSLVEALRAAFPVTARLMGERMFRPVAYEFVRGHPPAVPQLSAYGDHFSEFVGSLELGETGALLTDMARWEWAWNGAFFAADAAPLAIAAFQEIPQSDYAALLFAAHPSAHLFCSQRPILELWQHYREGGAGEGGGAPPDAAELRARHTLIVRPYLEVLSVALSGGEFTLLLALAAGATLGVAMQAALDTEAELDVSGKLARHLTLGTFIAARLDALHCIGDA